MDFASWDSPDQAGPQRASETVCLFLPVLLFIISFLCVFTELKTRCLWTTYRKCDSDICVDNQVNRPIIARAQ